ncbi:hypothetical protein AC781_11540 [Akkermansia glycaniphila]|nr:hypothetical protein AC781_11540 [Akkermansia glycaniphila]
MTRISKTDNYIFMQATKRAKIDWLSLSPRTMARVMEISNELHITPKDAFELMVAEAADRHADVTPNGLAATVKEAKQPA